MLVRNGASILVFPLLDCEAIVLLALVRPTQLPAHTPSDQLPDANTFIHRARRPNGATQTFRRTSNAVNTSNTVPQNNETIASPAASSQPPRYVPPHRNGTVTDPRYSKSQLLDLYRLQSTDDGLQDDLQNLYIGNWQPNGQNGAPAAGWGRNDASREQPSGPDVCWDDDGAYEPLALTEMDNEEKEVCTWRS
jgi:PERQ amino acid-rich with GYF domain-containing protein